MDEALSTIVSIVLIILLIVVSILMFASMKKIAGKTGSSLHREDERAQQNLRLIWMSRSKLLIRNPGEDTSLKYVYIFPSGGKKPISAIPVDEYLPSGGGKVISMSDLLSSVDISKVYPSLKGCPPGEGTGSSYHLCPMYYHGNDCDDACFTFRRDFPSKDSLVWDRSGLVFKKSRLSSEGADAHLSEVDPRFSDAGYNWSICAWIKVDEVGSGNDRLLAFADRPLTGVQYPDGTFFMHMDNRGNVYAVIRWRTYNIVLGRNENYDTAYDWHHYCVTINGTHALFFMDGELVDYEEADFYCYPLALEWLSFDKIAHSDYYVDDIVVSPTTFSLGEILYLYRTESPYLPGSVTWSFDYPWPLRIDLITDQGNVFTVRTRDIVCPNCPGGG